MYVCLHNVAGSYFILFFFYFQELLSSASLLQTSVLEKIGTCVICCLLVVVCWLLFVGCWLSLSSLFIVFHFLVIYFYSSVPSKLLMNSKNANSLPLSPYL